MYRLEALGGIIVIAVVLIIGLVAFGLGVANYIMTSMSLYTIANRRKISNPWLAWLPLGASWITGAIVDRHDEMQGVRRKWRITLLVLELIFYVAYIIGFVAMIFFIVAVGISQESSIADIGMFLGAFLVAYAVLIAAVLAATVLAFCRYICIYKIFEVTRPEKAIKYILLSLLVPLASAVCLLKCKDSILGMPKVEETIAYPLAQGAQTEE